MADVASSGLGGASDDLGMPDAPDPTRPPDDDPVPAPPSRLPDDDFDVEKLLERAEALVRDATPPDPQTEPAQSVVSAGLALTPETAEQLDIAEKILAEMAASVATRLNDDTPIPQTLGYEPFVEVVPARPDPATEFVDTGARPVGPSAEPRHPAPLDGIETIPSAPASDAILRTPTVAPDEAMSIMEEALAAESAATMVEPLGVAAAHDAVQPEADPLPDAMVPDVVADAEAPVAEPTEMDVAEEALVAAPDETAAAAAEAAVVAAAAIEAAAVEAAPAPAESIPLDHTGPHSPDAMAQAARSEPDELMTAAPQASRSAAWLVLWVPVWLLAYLCFAIDRPFQRLRPGLKQALGSVAIGTFLMACGVWAWATFGLKVPE